MFDYVILPIAQEEYEISVEWYAQRSEQATRNFILQVNKTLETICTNPHQFRNEYKKFYELGLKKYPFSIFTLMKRIPKWCKSFQFSTTNETLKRNLRESIKKSPQENQFLRAL